MHLHGSARVRDPAMDRLRGLAVVLMLFANLAPYLAPAPPPFWYRALATSCAPGFVLLAGLMVGLHRPTLAAAIRRGIALVAVGALLDVTAWGIAPFRSFDVLYLIGVSMPVLALAGRVAPWLTLALASIVFLVTPLAQEAWGHAADLRGLELVLHSAMLGGWFPLLPWLAVGAIGTALGAADVVDERHAVTRLAGWGTLLLLAGAAVWHVTDPALSTRGGYAELFYPPTFAVLGTFTGLVLLALAALKSWPTLPMTLLERFGRHSLLVYALHVLLIAHVIAPLSLERGWRVAGLGFAFLLASTALALGMIAGVPRRLGSGAHPVERRA